MQAEDLKAAVPAAGDTTSTGGPDAAGMSPAFARLGGRVSRSLPQVGLQVLDDAVPDALYGDLMASLARIGWRFGWRARNPNARYWHHEVGGGQKENTEDVGERVRRHPVQAFRDYMDWFRAGLGQPVSVLRFYLNAHTYGTDGSPHTDTERQGEHTIICYLTNRWESEWSGETVLFDREQDALAAVLPRRNRLAIFPSDVLHAPRPLARSFAGLRVVLVMKVRLEGDA